MKKTINDIAGGRQGGVPAAEKARTAEALRRYVGRYPSQNKAAASLRVSPATLSGILQGRTELVSDEMWRRLGARVLQGGEWQTVETRAWTEIVGVLDDMRRLRGTTWVTGEAGSGKTTAARRYATGERETYYVLCAEDMHKADFVRSIAEAVGVRTEGLTVRELWGRVLDALVAGERPLLIFDEADKLSEGCFHYFISLYNRVEDRCGVVLLSTDYIAARMQRGLRCRRVGYKEIWSRLGRRFYELEETDAADVAAICRANGVADEGELRRIVAEAERYDNDLRRVRKLVETRNSGGLCVR